MNGESQGKTSALQAVDGLRALVDPPLSGGNAIDWSYVATVYGHGFPDDYRAFMRAYGEGTFDNFLHVLAPVSEVYSDPSESVSGSTLTARYTAEEEEFDEPELLVAWGSTTDADLLCWYTANPDPNSWSTVIWRRHWDTPESWMRFECGMAEFLRRYVRHEIPHFWIDDLRYEGSRFVHSRDRRRWRRLLLDPWADEPLTA